MIIDRSIPVASRLVSVIVAGIAGGLSIGFAFPVVFSIADALGAVLARPEVSPAPTITPTSDHDLWIGVMVFLLLMFVLVPIFLAATGALSVKLSRKHLPDIKSCILISYAAGIVAIVTGIVLYNFTVTLVAGPSFEDVSLSSRIVRSTDSVIGWFTSPVAIVVTLLAALVSPAGGFLYWQARACAATK